MIKFRTTRGCYPTIVEVEVDRETEHSVWVDGKRRTKIGDYSCFFDTWDEARERIFLDAQRKVEVARLSLDRAKIRLGNIKGMKRDV